MSEVAGFANNVTAASDFLKLLANPDRLMIVCCLAQGEKPVTRIEAEIGVPQPRLSQQLAELREAGLITGRRAGKWVIYRIADRRTEQMVALLHDLFCAAPDC